MKYFNLSFIIPLLLTAFLTFAFNCFGEDEIAVKDNPAVAPEKKQALSSLHLETTYLIINTENDKLKQQAGNYAEFAMKNPEFAVDCINARLLIYFNLRDLPNYAKTATELFHLQTPQGQTSDWRNKLYSRHLHTIDMSHNDRYDWSAHIASEIVKNVCPFPEEDYVAVLRTYLYTNRMKPEELEKILRDLEEQTKKEKSPIPEELLFLLCKSTMYSSDTWDLQIKYTQEYLSKYGNQGKFSEKLYAEIIRHVTSRDILHNLKGRRKKEDDPAFWHELWKKDFGGKNTKLSAEVKKDFEQWTANRDRLQKGFSVNISPKDNNRMLMGWEERAKEEKKDFLMLLTGKKTVYKKGEPIVLTAEIKYLGDIITSMNVPDVTFPMVLVAGDMGIPGTDKEQYNELFIQEPSKRWFASSFISEKGKVSKLSFRKGDTKSFQVNSRNSPMLLKLPVGSHKLRVSTWYKHQDKDGKDTVKPLHSNDFVIDINP